MRTMQARVHIRELHMHESTYHAIGPDFIPVPERFGGKDGDAGGERGVLGVGVGGISGGGGICATDGLYGGA